MMQIYQRIIKRISKEIELPRLIRQRSREFRDDPNNNPSLVVQGCLDHPQNGIDDQSILKRVSAAYRKAKIAQREAAPAYQVSNEWLPIYKRDLGAVMKALEEDNLDNLATMYRNFFRDPCSKGLVGLPGNMKMHYFSGKIAKRHKLLYLYDMLCRYKLWHSLLHGRYNVRDLVSTEIGNPFGLEIDGVFIPWGSEYKHYYATELNRLTADEDHPVVVELGGGYGGMAYYLIRDSAKTTYVDFDLPENLALTGYYLLRAFPEMKIVLYGEEDLCDATLCNNRIVLMPSFEMTRMRDMSATAVFNSYSLAEMSEEAIEEYVAQLARLSGKYILHVNHTTDSLVSADDFGIERYGFRLLYRKPALWNRGRTLVVDECEYLYSQTH
jgi:hypothetical protein